jgi:hypothetical protein
LRGKPRRKLAGKDTGSGVVSGNQTKTPDRLDNAPLGYENVTMFHCTSMVENCFACFGLYSVAETGKPTENELTPTFASIVTAFEAIFFGDREEERPW